MRHSAALRDFLTPYALWLKFLWRRFALQTAEARDSFGELHADQLNWKPAADKWSIAQNMDHLIVINSSYFPIIESLKKGTYKAPFLGKVGFVVSFFGKMIFDLVNSG